MQSKIKQSRQATASFNQSCKEGECVDNITFGNIVGCLLGLLIVFVGAKIFFAPLRVILKLILNSLIGIGILYAVNLMKPMLNIYIGINAVSALVVGLLGIPGLCLLMLLQVFF